MEACYAGGEQFGAAAAEYGSAALCCGDSLDSLGELAASCELIAAECEPRADYDDMASFSLPSLDLDPLPALFPFSPCSGNYKGSECKEKGTSEEVLLSLRHAAAHAVEDAGSPHQLAVHSQMMVTPGSGGYPYYEQYASSAAPLFPTMSVNVSMNMTMHGYPPDQMCPQMQWNQSTPAPSVSVMYPQSQGMISPTSYPGAATYSFTADFRAPTQSDPLITATSSFKPIQIGPPNSKSNSTIPNYNIFSPSSYPSINQKVQNHIPSTPQMKTRSSSKLHFGEHQHHQQMANGYGPILNQSQMNAQEYGYLGGNLNIHPSIPSGGKVQMGSPSGCSGSEDEQKPNLCRICGKTYARPSTLKTHLRTHSGERPYRCVDCNKSFSQAANLTAHVRTHTGQKPFRCPICDRRFSQSSSVTTHMRTHSGERPYRCRACKKAFSDSSTLTKHLRIHSGEKPYQCKLCLLRFSQSGNLNRHMRVHGNNAAGLIG